MMAGNGENATAYSADRLKEAYQYYQRNIHAADQLIYRITLGARGNVSERELLGMALEALDRMNGTNLRAETEQE